VELLEELDIYEKKKGGDHVGFTIKALKTAALSIRGHPTEIVEGENALLLFSFLFKLFILRVQFGKF
jgi:hypothetical protein